VRLGGGWGRRGGGGVPGGFGKRKAAKPPDPQGGVSFIRDSRRKGVGRKAHLREAINSKRHGRKKESSETRPL